MRHIAYEGEILADNAVIGTGELNQLDPPMGVAVGPFTPTSFYSPGAHAWQIDGRENDNARKPGLTVRGPCGDIDCIGVSIADFSTDLGEIEVSVLGIAEFERYFADHPHFRSYWGLD
jgi:hypothetical protein